MTTLELMVAVFGSSGMIGGAVALFKLKPDVARVTVSAAEGAVIVQTGVITNLNNEITRLHEEVAEERRICDEEIARCQAEIKSLRDVFNKIDERQGARRGKLPEEINGIIPRDREEKG